MEIINKKKFAKAVLNENIKTFMVHMTSFSLSTISIHPTREAQIVLLIVKEVKILAKYSDFSDVFLEKKALVLPEITKFNQHTIEL